MALAFVICRRGRMAPRLQKQSIFSEPTFHIPTMKNQRTIGIIGGGASGMMAAIAAARLGARVVLQEAQERVGKKILATGNGRCNLTNSRCSPAKYHGEHPDFCAGALHGFPVPSTTAFFESLGALCKEEDEGRVFPVTGQASTILDVLRAEIARLGIEVRTQAAVREIIPAAEGFVLRLTGGQLATDRVIVTAGGKAAPHLGGTDSGLHLLEKLGHSIAPAYPVLVPLKTDFRFGRHLKGVKMIAGVKLEIQGAPAGHESGEILFTEYGISGPPIIQLSISANAALLRKQSVSLSLDLFPSWDEARLRDHLHDRYAARQEIPLDCACIGLVHKRMIVPFVQSSGIADAHLPAGRITPGETERMARLLKQWKFAVTGSLSWKDAHVMAGGVRTDGFNADALESLRVKGLFAAGEVLDITGDCGGHNLQWAWASGHTAGSSAAR